MWIGPDEEGRGAHRGVVQNEIRQALARALKANGPLTVRGLTEDTDISMAVARYHLRVLAAAGAVKPFLKGAARGDEVVWALSAENLAGWAQDLLLDEISYRTCMRLQGWIERWMDGRGYEDEDWAD